MVLQVLLALQLAKAIDSGHGVAAPPMGWRDWNQFLCDGHANPGNPNSTAMNQSLFEEIYDALADRSRMVDGVPTSLLDLGYASAGLDDCWQKCNSGPGGKGWHDADGNPIVNIARFPDLKRMADYAHSKGILAGWYFNNCDCRDSCSSDACFEGDVKAAVAYGFDSLKFDGCGGERNISKWHALLNATGRPFMIENCHNGPNSPIKGLTRAEQPFTFFRTSGDARSSFGSVLTNLQSVRAFTAPDVGPGAWRYADMLMVGVTNTQCPEYCPHGPAGAGPLTHSESRTQFAAWAVISSPMILGLDLRDTATVNGVWDIITAREVIAVSQTWAGDNGNLVAESITKVSLPYCDWSGRACEHASWQAWAKVQPDASRAVLLYNADIHAQTLAVSFAELGLGGGGTRCAVRDLWARREIGEYVGSYNTTRISAHDNAFVLVHNCSSIVHNRR